MADINAYSIGAFVLSVQDMNFAVSKFVLSKSLRTFNLCQITLADFNYLVQAKTASYPDVYDIRYLVQLVQSTVGNVVQCSLMEYKSEKNSNPVQWFRGCITSVNPSVSTPSGISINTVCTCVGKACRLGFSINNDFVNVPSAIINDISTLQKMNYLNAMGIVNAANSTYINLPFWGNGKLDDVTLISLSGQKIDDDIATLINKLSHTFQNQGQRQQVRDKLPEIDLSEYIRSAYKLNSKYKTTQKTYQHPYFRNLGSKFINTIKGGTIWDSILVSITGQNLLTLKPPARGKQDIMQIIPDGILKYNGYFITKNQLIGCTLSSQYLSRIRIPDILYINLADLSSFQSGTPVPLGLYGRYPGLNSNIPSTGKQLRVKSMLAPSWLLKTQLQVAQKRSRGDSNKTPKLTNDLKQVKQLELQTIADNNGSIQLADYYAKSLYFNMYCRNKGAYLYLTVNQRTLQIDNQLGYSIKFQCPIDQHTLNQPQLSTYYGRLSSVQYQYRSAQSPQQKSYMTISCQLQAVTKDDDSRFIQIFQDGPKLCLYQQIKNKGKK